MTFLKILMTFVKILMTFLRILMAFLRILLTVEVLDEKLSIFVVESKHVVFDFFAFWGSSVFFMISIRFLKDSSLSFPIPTIS